LARVLSGKGKKFLGVLADPGLDVVAGYVMPHHSVLVEVVQDGDARLISSVFSEFAVIWLGPATAAGVGPVSPPASSAVGGGNAGAGAGPEPAVHQRGLQVRPFAAIEVAFAT